MLSELGKNEVKSVRSLSDRCNVTTNSKKKVLDKEELPTMHEKSPPRIKHVWVRKIGNNQEKVTAQPYKKLMDALEKVGTES